MLNCGKCGSEYEPFGQRFNRCKPCLREYQREANKRRSECSKQKRRDHLNRIRSDKRKLIESYKDDKSCKYCDECENACLEFHHLNPNEKDFQISRAVSSGKTWEEILIEIEKCDIVCSNCHKKIHAGLL